MFSDEHKASINNDVEENPSKIPKPTIITESQGEVTSLASTLCSTKEITSTAVPVTNKVQQDRKRQGVKHPSSPLESDAKRLRKENQSETETAPQVLCVCVKT